jgi:hypothetical protein
MGGGIYKIAEGIAGILTGVVSPFRPRIVLGFTGLGVDGGIGITEIQSDLG